MKHEFKPFDKVLHRYSVDGEWVPGLYSRPSVNGMHFVQGVPVHQMCIPYEGNEHLLGTMFNPGQKNRFEYGDKVEITDTHMEHWREALYLHGCTDGGGHSVYDREARMISWASDSCIRHAKIEPKYQALDSIEFCHGDSWESGTYAGFDPESGTHTVADKFGKTINGIRDTHLRHRVS